MFTFVAFAANPSGGSITPTGANLTWNGTATGVPPTAGGEGSCVEGTNCDSYTLTITGTPADWIAAQKQVHVEINWTLPASDYDLYIHKGTLAGPVVGSSANAGTTQEQVDLNPASSSIGTGTFTVHAVYYAPAPGDQYRGLVSTVATGAPPVPAPAGAGLPPRFEIYNPPAMGLGTLGRSSGEPSIGVGRPIAGHPEGRAMFQSDVQTLRVTFNGCARALWENKPAPTSAQDFDPILFTDLATGQTIVHLLTFAGNVIAGESSVTNTAPPMNDGDVYTASQGAGIASGIDHQTVGGGPYHAPLTPPNPAYPRTVWYCSQALVDASCARSDDGGITYGPSVVTYTSECGGLHGHVKIGPDGTVYLPNKGCGGLQGAAVSEDNGVTWNIRRVPASTPSGSDPSMGIDAGNKVYFGYADGDTKAIIATSTDQGRNWSQPLDVGASFGINNVAFPAVTAGDAGRAAFAFLGTPTAGGLQGPRFTGVWHLYVATTYDGGATWSTVDATPNDPVQRGCIWEGGGANVCRNMLDFMDLQQDQEGRLMVGFADGCAGAECIQAKAPNTGNAYTALASIARQSGGRRMRAAFDPAGAATTPAAPGTPSLSAQRNGGAVRLSWSEGDNGGSGVNSYTILRGTAAGGETFLASVPGTQTRYDDSSASNPLVTYYYKVVAVNGQGSSCGDNEVSAAYFGSSSTGTGFAIANDPTGDVGAAANPDLDIQTLSILEPSTGVNAGKLVFNLKVTSLATIPNERMWRIVWNSPNSPTTQAYVGMTKDASGTITYDYGTVSTATVGLVLGVPSTTRVGSPDSGSFTPDGLITIVVSKDKIGDVRTGDLLGALSARTYATVTNEIRSTNAIDTTSNAISPDPTTNAFTYAIVGPIPGLNSVVTRKTHGAAGTFDIPLNLTGRATTEPRTGGANGSHQLVFNFDTTGVTVNGTPQAAVTSGSGSVSGVTVNGSTVTVNLTGVQNGQVTTVTLNNASYGVGIGNVSASFAPLLGDTNDDSFVNAGDATQTRNRSGMLADPATFRSDVNLDGVVNSGDAAIVRAAAGSSVTAVDPAADGSAVTAKSR